jgi:hypothetical protein
VLALGFASASGFAPAPGFTPALALALALGFAVMASVKTAGGNALLQLLQLEIQVFHRVYLLSSGIITTGKNLIVPLSSLGLCKPRQCKLHP